MSENIVVKFTDLIVVKLLPDGRNYQLYTPFYFYFDENKKEEGITIPAGFITDFASIPRVFWSILPPVGNYAAAALVHDYLYGNGISLGMKRKFCDEMLLEGMRALKVSRAVRYVMYCAVRVFGGKRFINSLQRNS